MYSNEQSSKKYNSPIIQGQAGVFDPKLNPEISQQLSQIRPAIASAQKLLKTDIHNLSEDQITEVQRQIRPAQHLYNQLDKGRRTFKRRLNGFRDFEMRKAGTLLDGYGYADLRRIYPKLKALKNSIWGLRRNKRWQQLQDTFDQAIHNNPIINTMAPILTSMDNFRAFYPKLVTSRKNGHITQKTRGKVNNIVHQWASDLAQIKQNLLGLDQQHQKALINEYIQDPSKFQHNELTQKAAEQLQDQKHKNAEKQKLLKQAEMEKAGKKPQPQPKPKQNNTNSDIDIKWLWLVSEIKDENEWQNLNSVDPHVKETAQAGILYAMFNNVLNPKSTYAIHTHRKAHNIVEAVKFILNR